MSNECDLCEEHRNLELRAQCHLTAPLRVSREGSTLTVRCYVPECNRLVATMQLADVQRPPLTHVAIRFRGQVWSLPKPYRHHHVIRTIAYLDSDVDHVDAHGDDQGFLDASGRYLRRAQALVSAQVNGQLKNGRIIGGTLTSEDVW